MAEIGAFLFLAAIFAGGYFAGIYRARAYRIAERDRYRRALENLHGRIARHYRDGGNIIREFEAMHCVTSAALGRTEPLEQPTSSLTRAKEG